ncbi:hypothetical protein AEAC466_12995 [Asticcacaulis sp. AC466]|nr:hypothetical protein AEAC466_12995 [Asticcacaulis sp. AC466]
MRPKSMTFITHMKIRKEARIAMASMEGLRDYMAFRLHARTRLDKSLITDI